MAKNKIITVYGIPPLSPEEIIGRQNELFQYLKSLIVAEKLNPEPDFEQERYIEFLKKISLSDISLSQRDALIELLENNENE